MLEIPPSEWIFLRPSPVARNSLYHAASNGAALRLFQFHGFFEARVRLFPRPRERRQIISHISRARLTTIFFRPLPSFFFSPFNPDGPPRWIIILALLDRIFGADDPAPGGPGRTRSCLTSFRFVQTRRVRRDAGRESSRPNAPARLSYSRRGATIRIHVAIIWFVPFDKGWRSGAS